MIRNRSLALALWLGLSLVLATGGALAWHSACRAPAQPAQASFRLDWLGQIGGVSYAVARQGDLLFFGVGPRLVIWNVANPAAPVQVGRTAVLSDVIIGIDVEGNYAYLACERGGLRIIEISDPAAPQEVGSYQIAGNPSEAYKVDVVGDTAYVTDRLRGLRVVDVSNPARPTEAGFVDTPGFAVDVTVVGHYAYVADESYRLQIIDVSEPANPLPVSFDSYYPLSYVWALAADGSTLYLATADGLDIASLADPEAPVLVGSYASQQTALDVAVSGNTAYLVADGLEIIDLGDPAHPQREGVFPTRQTSWGCPAEGGSSLKPCRNVAVAGGYAYVVDDAFGLSIVDVANPAQPFQVAAYEGLGRVTDVAPAGAYALTVQRNRGMHVLNVSNPAAPTIIGAFPLTGTVQSVAVQGDYAYVGNGYPGISGLYVVSIANPARPVQAGFTDTVGEPNHITLRGNYAYLTTGYEWQGFQIVDVADPAHPTERGAVIGDDMVAGGYDVALDGDRAYVADWGTVRLVDVSDPNAPYLQGVYDPGSLSYIYSVAADGSHVYLTDWDDLYVLDWTNPVSPTVAGSSLGGLGWGEDIALSGGMAYVAAEQYGLFALDVSVTEAITLVDRVETPGLALDVEVEGDLIYVALGDGGLAVFSASPYAAGVIPPSGGVLASPDGMVTYSFPTGVFSETVVITHTTLLPGQVPEPGGSLAHIRQVFQLEAAYVSSGQAAQPGGPYTLTLTYDPATLGPVNESTLGLYAWRGSAWHKESLAGPDMVAHTLVATPDHFSYWAVLGETRRVFLPLVLSGRHEP